MKFNVVIGNPPYNRQLYKRFVELAPKISRIQCMIIPAAWSDNANDIVAKTISRTCKHLIYYIDTKDVFDIYLIGGISIYSCSNSYNSTLISVEYGKTSGGCLVENRWSKNSYHNNSLLRQLVWLNNQICLNNIAYKIINKIYNSFGGALISVYNYNKMVYKMDPYDINNVLMVATDSPPCDNPLKLYISSSEQKYITPDLIGATPDLMKYKICVHERVGFTTLPDNKKDLQVFKRAVILNKNTLPAGSMMLIMSSDSYDEIKNFEKYYNSKFVRFLAFVSNMSSHYSRKEVWRFIPLEDFSTSDTGIDWDNNIDRQLYHKYNLDTIEIDAIENTIKDIKDMEEISNEGETTS